MGAEGVGKDFKEAVKRGEWRISLGGFGECLARWENYAELDKTVVDAWGVPALRISATYCENERKMGEFVANDAAEMLEAAGAKNVRTQKQMDPFGHAIHEVGVARMGDDPEKSVLNKYCQSHDIKNLFVMDGSCFVSIGCQNPTLTMMAIVGHSCDYLVRQARKGEI